MKTRNFILASIFSSTLFSSCDELGITTQCAADLTIASLDLAKPFITGEPITLICVIKNIVSAASGCEASDPATVTVTCGYSPTFQERFSQYQVFDESVSDQTSIEPGTSSTDRMMMATPFGPGYYAMKIEVEASNDYNPENNNIATTILAD